jgi:TatD DNase family protein
MAVDYLLMEPEAPDQPDAAIRGQRNEPARIAAVLDCIAALRNESPDTIAAATTANAARLFRFPGA